MKRLHVPISLAMLVLLLAGTAQPGLSKPPAPASMHARNAPAGTAKVYLPLVISAPAAASGSSFDLIDQAIAAKQITAEQGLIYKVFAQFSDSRLPAQFVGTGPGRGGDMIMEQVADQAQAGTLSASAIQTLTPFFVPPDDSRSWYYLSTRMGAKAAGPRASPASWTPVPAAGGKIRIFYFSDNASDAAKANDLAAEFTGLIYNKLTKLMGQEPIPNSTHTTDIYLWTSYLKSDGITVVQFGNTTLGITVGARCDQSSVNIYLPDWLPIGSPYSAGPGLVQYATHEFMHAIQFSYTIQSCSGYRWLKEATATWAEDYVYPAVNSEQDVAPNYLDHPTARLDDETDLHQYGTYLLFYYLTHSVDTSAAVIRDIWQNAGSDSNSYMAIHDAVAQAAPGWEDIYWPMFLATLWNKAPFNTYYATKDGLAATVAPAGGAPTDIKVTGNEDVTPLYAQIPTGGALFFDLKFPDTSLRSLTILNGLGYKLYTGDATSRIEFGTEGDETYLTDDLSSDDLQGANVELLLKASGQPVDPEPAILSDDQANDAGGGLAQFDHCMDAQGNFDEVVVILSNSDWGHPDRIMQPVGLPVTVWANNIPCYQVKGSFTALDYDDGATVESQGTMEFGFTGDSEELQPYVDWGIGAFPETYFDELSVNAKWSASGTDTTGCVHTGSATWTASSDANGYMTIEQGLLPGSPTYRQFEAQASPESGTTVTEHIACPDTGSYDNTGDPIDWAVNPRDPDCPPKIDASGNISGNCTVPNYTGRYQKYTWSLSPMVNHSVRKPGNSAAGQRTGATRPNSRARK